MTRIPYLRRNAWLLLAALSTAFIAPACEEDSDDTPTARTETRTVNDFYAPGDARNGPDVVLTNNPYKLVNLTTGDTTVRLNQATATSWDIGFRTLDIITNGGTNVSISRPDIEPARQGSAEYVLVTNTPFESLTQVPTSGFTTDAAGRPNATVGTGQAATRPIVRTQLTTVNGQQASVVLPAPGTILVVKLATSNRYAKIEILSYYKGYPQGSAAAPANPFTGQTPWYSFRYAITAPGSTTW